MPERVKKPEGLGGWLLLPIFLFIYSSVMSIKDAVTFLSDSFYILSILSIISFFLFSYTLNLIFRKSKSTKKWVIISLLFGLVTPIFLVLIGLAEWELDLFSYLAIKGFFVFLWITYFQTSERVNNTFTK